MGPLNPLSQHTLICVSMDAEPIVGLLETHSLPPPTRMNVKVYRSRTRVSKLLAEGPLHLFDTMLCAGKNLNKFKYKNVLYLRKFTNNKNVL